MTGNEGKVVAKDEVVLLRMGGGRGWEADSGTLRAGPPSDSHLGCPLSQPSGGHTFGLDPPQHP